MSLRIAKTRFTQVTDPLPSKTAGIWVDHKLTVDMNGAMASTRTLLGRPVFRVLCMEFLIVEIV